MTAIMLKMASSRYLCLLGGKSLTAIKTTFASVVPIFGRAIVWSSPTVTPMEHPRATAHIKVDARAAAVVKTRSEILSFNSR
jgi:hypothetical protein